MIIITYIFIPLFISLWGLIRGFYIRYLWIFRTIRQVLMSFNSISKRLFNFAKYPLCLILTAFRILDNEMKYEYDDKTFKTYWKSFHRNSPAFLAPYTYAVWSFLSNYSVSTSIWQEYQTPLSTPSLSFAFPLLPFKCSQVGFAIVSLIFCSPP